MGARSAITFPNRVSIKKPILKFLKNKNWPGSRKNFRADRAPICPLRKEETYLA